MRPNKNRAPQCAFTVVELIMIIMMIGILCAIIFPRILDFRKEAALRKNGQVVNIIAGAVERARADGIELNSLVNLPDGPFNIQFLVNELRDKGLIAELREITTNQVSCLVEDNLLVFYPTMLP